MPPRPPIGGDDNFFTDELEAMLEALLTLRDIERLTEEEKTCTIVAFVVRLRHYLRMHDADIAEGKVSHIVARDGEDVIEALKNFYSDRFMPIRMEDDSWILSADTNPGEIAAFARMFYAGNYFCVCFSILFICTQRHLLSRLFNHQLFAHYFS